MLRSIEFQGESMLRPPARRPKIRRTDERTAGRPHHRKPWRFFMQRNDHGEGRQDDGDNRYSSSAWRRPHMRAAMVRNVHQAGAKRDRSDDPDQDP